MSNEDIEGELFSDDEEGDDEEENEISFEQFMEGLCHAVVAVCRDGSNDDRVGLEAQLSQLQNSIEGPDAEELSVFLEVLRGILLKHDMSGKASELSNPFLTTYEVIKRAIVAENPVEILNEIFPNTPEDEEEGEGLSLEELVDRVSSLTVTVMQSDNLIERARLATYLSDLREQLTRNNVEQAKELVDLDAYLATLTALLRGQDTVAVAAQLEDPYIGIYNQIKRLIGH